MKTTTIALAAAVMICGVSCKKENKKVEAPKKPVVKTAEVIKPNVFTIQKELCKSFKRLDSSARDYYANLNSRIDDYYEVVEVLQRNDEKRIKSKISSIKRKLGYRKSSLKRNERELDRGSKKFGNIEKLVVNPEADKLDKENKSLANKITKLRQPLDKERSAYYAEINLPLKRRELEADMRKIYPRKAVDGIYAKYVHANFKDGFTSVNWYIGKMQVAWAHIHIKQLPKDKYKDKLGGKYPISNISNNGIWFWVGNFQVAFSATDSSMHGKDNIKAAAMKIAKPIELLKLSRKKLIFEAIAASKFSRKNRKQIENKVGKLQSQKYKLYSQLRKLNEKGMYSQVQLDQIHYEFENLKNRIDNYKKQIKDYDYFIKLLQGAANSRSKAISDLKSKIAKLTSQVADFAVKHNKKKAEISSEIDFKADNLRYLDAINKFARIPKGKEYAIVNRLTSKAALGFPDIEYKWEAGFTTGDSEILTGEVIYAPDYEPSHVKGLIDDKYAIIRVSKYSIKIRAGSFTVVLNANYYGFKNPEILKKAVNKFYDLDAIANADK